MFPYEKHRASELWEEIDKILSDLEENNDIELTTARQYVIGYFCEQLTKSRVEVSDLGKYIARRKRIDKAFAKDFEKDFEEFQRTVAVEK